MALCLLAYTFLSSTSTILLINADLNQRFDQNYLPTKCESCLILSAELQNAVAKLPKMKEIEAEGWFIDEIENVCALMLSYRIHKEKIGLERFSKDTTKTAQAINQLIARGVEVKMDIPVELINQPSVESGKLKEHCEWIIAQFEDELNQWFFNRRKEIPISEYLCHGKFVGFDPICRTQNTEL